MHGIIIRYFLKITNVFNRSFVITNLTRMDVRVRIWHTHNKIPLCTLTERDVVRVLFPLKSYVIGPEKTTIKKKQKVPYVSVNIRIRLR